MQRLGWCQAPETQPRGVNLPSHTPHAKPHRMSRSNSCFSQKRYCYNNLCEMLREEHVSVDLGVRNLRWQPHFRHSAGRLGSHFIRAMREGRLLGWKTPSLGVTVPPIDTGEAGEWVDIGPNATLLACVPNDSVTSTQSVLAMVKIDGADAVTLVHVACEDRAELLPGMTLTARFDVLNAASTLPAFQVAPSS